MVYQWFDCIDAHTCGNPVRVITSGAPALSGSNMFERRQDFLAHHDWVRKALMFEPRGHDMMSGSILFPPDDPANDVGVLYVETSGCLPMCGHGTIGTVTVAIEKGLVKPKKEGFLNLETPAGIVKVEYEQKEGKVKWVKLTNVPSFLYQQDIPYHFEPLGDLKIDIAYGGNFYAIIEVQENFKGLQEYTAEQLITWSRSIRNELNQLVSCIHPANKDITGLSHMLWCGEPIDSNNAARNAVFYGDKAIDRSPCGTGTSARMAQRYAKGLLKKGEAFSHESYIGSVFEGMIEEELDYHGYAAIRPSIKGWATITGENKILVDEANDPYAFGFQVI